ncbi:MAG: hypothetical protein ACKV2Q_34275 [Planctomycetaceae bacterium]
MYFLASPSLVEQVAGVKEQTTRDFVPISEQYLLFHRIPPLSEQQEIVRRVEKLFAFADQIESRLRQAQAHVDRLTQSLLAKAFRGELVPTEHTLATADGRDYESASALLARIHTALDQASNSDVPKQKRSRRKG